MKVAERIEMDRRWILGFAIAGALGLGATGLGWGIDLRRALFAYLFAFDYWVGIAVASLTLLCIFHACGARWPVVIRRALEVQSSTVWLFPVLFVPIALGVETLFPWADHSQIQSDHLLEIVNHQYSYSNIGFWVVRAGIYFVVWIAVAELLLRWSRRQDETGALSLTQWQRWLAAGSLPIIALAFSFAALDWVMSPDPSWNSTIFGIYFWVGAFLAALGLLSLVVVIADRPNLFGGLANANHRASLGKFLFGFTAFWAYIAFDQFMLVWIADLPDELHWFKVRIDPGWGWFSILLIGLQFLVPFFALLSRDLKRSRIGLGIAGVWMLVAHVWDTYWMVLPNIDPGGPNVHWEDVVAFIGVGCVTIAFGLWRMAGDHPVPVRDPYLLESLRYQGK